MASTFYWVIENRVLYTHFSGILTPETTAQGCQYIADLLAERDLQKVNYIADARDLKTVRGNVLQLGKAVAPLMSSGRTNWMVMVSGSAFIRSLASITAQMTRQQWRMTADWNETIRVLGELDPTLPPLPMLAPSGSSIQRFENLFDPPAG